MSDPRDDTELNLNDQGEMRSAEPDGIGDEDGLQTSTGGGMGPESFPPEDDENYRGNGANRGPS